MRFLYTLAIGVCFIFITTTAYLTLVEPDVLRHIGCAAHHQDGENYQDCITLQP